MPRKTRTGRAARMWGAVPGSICLQYQPSCSPVWKSRYPQSPSPNPGRSPLLSHCVHLLPQQAPGGNTSAHGPTWA